MNESSTNRRVELPITGVRYYSRGDEDAFFYWLKNIVGVIDYAGQGRTLYVNVDVSLLTFDAFYNLYALHRRYLIEPVALKMLDVLESNRTWLHDPETPWHQSLFAT